MILNKEFRYRNNFKWENEQGIIHNYEFHLETDKNLVEIKSVRIFWCCNKVYSCENIFRKWSFLLHWYRAREKKKSNTKTILK